MSARTGDALAGAAVLLACPAVAAALWIAGLVNR